MDLLTIIKIFIERGKLKKSEKKPREEIIASQAKAFSELRAYAYSNSGFYKKFHEGLFDKPLNELPVLTKKILMENFDNIVTDMDIHKADVEAFVKTMSVGSKFKNKYTVSTTGGTTGLKGLFLYNRDEWAKIVASYSRANDWGGMKVNIFTKLKIAVVSSTVAWHQSSQVGNTLKTPFIKTLRVDSTERIENIVEKLNRFKPKILVGYPSMAFALAEEQLKGNLAISPQICFCAAEVLTGTIKKTIYKAWNIEPYNVYAATETANIASECNLHNGLHLYEDLIIPEVVDENYNPVPPGVFGEKLLVTVLFSRTIPLIRYEITDSVKLSERICTCGLPFKMIEEIQGRFEDTVVMQGKNGKVKVHPNVFHKAFENNISQEWQVIQTGENSLEIRFRQAVESQRKENLLNTLRTYLSELEIHADIVIKDNIAFNKTAIGKNILIQALKEK